MIWATFAVERKYMYNRIETEENLGYVATHTILVSNAIREAVPLQLDS